MTWFRMDDKFHSHPKVLAAGNAAVGLWVRCATWSADHGTDGKIPVHVARTFGTTREAETLVTCRLWTIDGDSYEMPDYLEFNPSREEAEAVRRKRSEAGSKGGKASKPQANAQALASPLLGSGLQHAQAKANPRPDPTRPDPRTQVSTQPQPPTDCREVGGEISSERIEAVVDAYASQAVSVAKAKGINIASEAGYKRKARATALANEDTARLAAMFPTAPPDVIAAAVHGEKASLQYYPRADELADVVELRPA